MVPSLLLAASLTCFAPTSSRAEVKEAMKSGDTISKCVHPAPNVLYMFGPNCEETILRAGQSSRMSYNQKGLRDKNYPSKPQPGWTRILFLGSSILAAPGLPESGTPPRLLEAKLRKLNKKVEVINAGVEGYSAIQIAALASELIKEYSPTHVLLFLNIDQSANSDPINSIYSSWEPNGTVTLKNEIFPISLRLASILSWDSTQYPVRRRLQTMQGLGGRFLDTWSCLVKFRSGITRSQCMLGATLRSFEVTRNLSERSGAKFLLIPQVTSFNTNLKISPGQDLQTAIYFDKITPTVTVYDDEIRALLEGSKIPLSYYDSDFNSDDLLPGDYHLSSAGASKFASVLEPKVSDWLRK